MRTLLISFAVLASISLSGGAVSEPRSEVRHGGGLADMRDAAIGLPQEYRITDNYGDPDEFVKYIIRKPPVFA